MQVKYNMVVDFARPAKSNTILVAENDANSRKCTFTLLFDKEPFDMTGVTTATIMGITSTGARIYADATIEEDEEGNKINVIYWVIPAALTDTAGNITLTVTLMDNVGGRITSFEFFVKVRNALYNEDDFIDEDDMAGFRDLLARTRAALEKMEQMVQQDALPNPYPLRITVDNVEYEYKGDHLEEIIMGEVAYLGDVVGTVEITADDSAAAQAARSAALAAQSAGDAEQAFTDTRLLIDNFQSQIPTATVTKNVATHQSVISITDKNGTTTAVVEDGVVGSSWYAGTDLIGKTTGITGYAGNEGDYYLNTATGNVYRCSASGSISTALWDYVLTMGSNTFNTFKVSTTNITAEGNDTLELKAGNNVTLVPDLSDKSITIHATGSGGGGGGGTGDMLKAVYDRDNDGIVNCADTLNNMQVSVSELNNLSGITANVQDQLDAKAPTSHTHTSAQITDLAIPDDLADLNDDATHRLVTDTEKSTWNGKQDVLQAGTGIQINGNTISATASTQLGYKTVRVGNVDIDASIAEDAIKLEAGNNVTITPDATNKKITIHATGGGGGSSTGDMLKIVYDQNNNGIVDNAETLNGLTASIDELNYSDGVTSNIQDQLDGKAASAHTHVKTDITDFPTIPTAMTQLDMTGDSQHRVVTDAQIQLWTNKQSVLQAGTGIQISGNVISSAATAIGDLDDVTITTPVGADEFLGRSNGAWVNKKVGIGDLSGATISNPQPNDVLKYDGTEWVNGTGGGHTMIPIEEQGVTDIERMQLLANGNDNYVINAYSAKRWSNAEVIKILTDVPQNADTVGKWEDDGVWENYDPTTDNPRVYREGWLFDEALFGVVDDDSITIEPVFSINKNETISWYAYRLDDEVYMPKSTPTGNPKEQGWYELVSGTFVLTTDTSVVSGKTYYVGGGTVAFKMNGAVQNANGVRIGIALIHQRTEVHIVSPIT